MVKNDSVCQKVDNKESEHRNMFHKKEPDSIGKKIPSQLNWAPGSSLEVCYFKVMCKMVTMSTWLLNNTVHAAHIFTTTYENF